ncbi:hypothetical protein ACFWH1_18830 [Streptomyces sp. NPDC127037]|uniref:hypothetical protein n=1 Tax=Streptomyces sp. NPDC127037 TaxID=3347113 RepID=UPI00365FDBD3
MAGNSSPQLSAATALVELLDTHPELSALAWTVDTLGVLRGELTGDASRGRIVDDCAHTLGGTPVRVRVDEHGSGFAELAAVWRDVPVQVWVTYSAPVPRRPLGTVATAGGVR